MMEVLVSAGGGSNWAGSWSSTSTYLYAAP